MANTLIMKINEQFNYESYNIRINSKFFELKNIEFLNNHFIIKMYTFCEINFTKIFIVNKSFPSKCSVVKKSIL